MVEGGLSDELFCGHFGGFPVARDVVDVDGLMGTGELFEDADGGSTVKSGAGEDGLEEESGATSDGVG